MENGNITSTNPYNFTFGFPTKFQGTADPFLNGPYRIYFYGTLLLPKLILHSLNNVNLRLMNDKDLLKGMLNMNVTRWSSEHAKNSFGVRYGTPSIYHVSPLVSFNSFVIISAVRTERSQSEVLSLQGLGDLVWVLVALSLFAVSAVSYYIDYRKRTRRESRFTSFAKSLWVHAADILNNSVACAKKVAVPLRHTRAWWLLGVTIIIQFWCAGLKSNLIVDDFLLVDSLEDLLNNPKIICYFSPTSRISKLFESENSKYTKLRQQLRRNGELHWQFDKRVAEKFASGKAVVIDEDSTIQRPALFKKLKRNKRKMYVGKNKFEEFYTHMFFNKRLPRVIKERIDYV